MVGNFSLPKDHELPGVCQWSHEINDDVVLNLICNSSQIPEPDPERVWEAMILQSGKSIDMRDCPYFQEYDWQYGDSENVGYVFKISEGEVDRTVDHLQKWFRQDGVKH